MKKIILAITFLVLVGVGYYAISPLFINVVLNEEVPTNSDEVSLVGNPEKVTGTAGHPASGTVRLVTSGGKKFVRYENYQTINGPDLFVYLASDIEATNFISLGKLKATEGNVNYEIPAEIDISQYPYVLTWCKQFGVLFNYAEIAE